MNSDEFQGEWKQLKGRLREQWGKLTDDDIERGGGRKERLLGMIQEKYGVAKQEAERLLDGFLQEFRAGYAAKEREIAGRKREDAGVESGTEEGPGRRR